MIPPGTTHRPTLPASEFGCFTRLYRHSAGILNDITELLPIQKKK